VAHESSRDDRGLFCFLFEGVTMMRPLRIAVADDQADMIEHYRQSLQRLGHAVVAVAKTGSELIEICRAGQPELIITDINMPDMNGIEAAARIYRDKPIPVILVSGYHDADYIARAADNHVLGYLIKPVDDAHLATAIGVAIGRFEEFQALSREAADLRQALSDRKVIEQAKGILMKRAGLEEAEAFDRLRKLSMDQNRKLVDIAQMIVTAERAFMPVARPAPVS
jgi:response regulator NasT